jgi:putative transposase
MLRKRKFCPSLNTHRCPAASQPATCAPRRHVSGRVGACRLVFNKTLALHDENYRNGGKFISQFAMEKHLTAWRELPDAPWLKDSPRSAQNKAIEDLDRALKNFFEQHAVFPCFQRKGQPGDHFRSPDKKAITLDAANGRIKLPRLGWIRYRNSESCSAICPTSPYRATVASDMRET